VRYDDWGQRSPRWAGIRSTMTSIFGVPVHYLTAGGSSPADDAPTHLLVPPMAGSASAWIDLLAPLAALGPVVAVDPPGTVTGHTGAPYRYGPRAGVDARSVRAVIGRLALDRVVLHGWSMGGLVAALAADLVPATITGLVLVAPTLPWRRTARFEQLAWQTLGRAALAVGVPVARAGLRLAGPRALTRKRAAVTGVDVFTDTRVDLLGGDPSLVSPEQAAVWVEDLTTAAQRPQLLVGGITAFASAMTAMFVDQQPVLDVLDRLPMPVLLLWGTDDPLADPPSYRQHAERPGWTPHAVQHAGHLLPIERPDECVDAVRDWLTHTQA
jgi:pimeloyl-ACP methyl ester carboxylesterase